MAVIRILLVMLLVLPSGCSTLLEWLRDTAIPYTVIKKSGGLYLVRNFNHWSWPGNDKGGPHYPMRYNRSTNYRERGIQLPRGLCHICVSG